MDTYLFKGDMGHHGLNGTNGTNGEKGDKGNTSTFLLKVLLCTSCMDTYLFKGDMGHHGLNGTNGTNGEKGQKGNHSNNDTIGLLCQCTCDKGDNGQKGDIGPKGVMDAFYIFVCSIQTECFHLTSGSDTCPIKVELMCPHSKKCDYHEYLHITMKPVFVLTKTSLLAVILIR